MGTLWMVSVVNRAGTRSVHGSQGNSNRGDLCRLGAARVAVICAGRSRNKDATCFVYQRVRSRGAGGDVSSPPYMMMHVAVLM